MMMKPSPRPPYDNSQPMVRPHFAGGRRGKTRACGKLRSVVCRILPAPSRKRPPPVGACAFRYLRLHGPSAREHRVAVDPTSGSTALVHASTGLLSIRYAGNAGQILKTTGWSSGDRSGNELDGSPSTSRLPGPLASVPPSLLARADEVIE